MRGEKLYHLVCGFHLTLAAFLRNSAHHIELLLQLLVGIVDAELLKCVYIKHFETINVQHSNEQGVAT